MDRVCAGRHTSPMRNGVWLVVGLVIACTGKHPGNNSNPAPSITALSPTSGLAGGPDFTLTLNGSGFIASSQVQWNGSQRPTTFVGATQLTTVIPAADIVAAGAGSLTVSNPTPGGGVSAPMMYALSDPAPLIASLSPSSGSSEGPAFTLTVNGSGFVAATQILWNGSPVTTSYVSGSQVTAAIPAAFIGFPGASSVTAVSPTPGGGTAVATTFSISGSVIKLRGAGRQRRECR